MTYDEMIAVIAAKRDGKKIESQWLAKREDKWLWDEMGPNDAFNFGCFRYRIAPEPLTVWVIVYVDGELGGAYDSDHKARASGGSGVDRIVKCVEVTE